MLGGDVAMAMLVMISATTAQASNDRCWRRRGAVLPVQHERAAEADGLRHGIVIDGSIPNRCDNPPGNCSGPVTRYDEEAAFQSVVLNAAR